MRKHGGPPSRHDKYVQPASTSPPGVARGRFVWGQQSGLAGCKSPPSFKRRAFFCLSQRQRQREPLGASPRPTDLPTYLQQQLPSATLGFFARAEKGTDHKINKLYLSQEWRGQSDHIIIHAVHANRALPPSKP